MKEMVDHIEFCIAHPKPRVSDSAGRKLAKEYRELEQQRDQLREALEELTSQAERAERKMLCGISHGCIKDARAALKATDEVEI